MLTTDVHLADTLQFYVRYLRDNGDGPILLFVIHLRPCTHGAHSLRLAVLVSYVLLQRKRGSYNHVLAVYCPDKRYEYEYLWWQ